MTYASVVSVEREKEKESGIDVSGGLRAEGHMWWVREKCMGTEEEDKSLVRACKLLVQACKLLVQAYKLLVRACKSQVVAYQVGPRHPRVEPRQGCRAAVQAG